MGESIPHLQKTDLIKSLRTQGFEVTERTHAIRVVAEDGKALDVGNNVFDKKGSYAEATSRLRRLGWDPFNRPRKESIVQTAESITGSIEVPDLDAKVLDLYPRQYATFMAVQSEPGESLQVYLEKVGGTTKSMSSLLIDLVNLGAIRREGKTRATRYFPQKVVAREVGTMSSSGRPSAGPVRTRKIESDDPLVQMRQSLRKLREQAAGIQTSVDSVLAVLEPILQENAELKAKQTLYEKRAESLIEAL